MSNSLITAEEGNMLFKMASTIAATEFVPSDMRGRVPEVYAALLFGREVGLSPMASVQNVAVINGKPSLWGDAALAIVQTHPSYEWHQESTFEEIADTGVAVFRVKRAGNPEPFVSKFSVDDAKRAHLWGRKGPWSSYPFRMLQMRARGFGLRNAFADAMRGLVTAEEAGDAVQVAAPAPVAPVAIPAPVAPVAIPAPAALPEPEAIPAPDAPPPGPPESEAPPARKPRKARAAKASPKPSPHVVESQEERGGKRSGPPAKGFM